MIKLLPEIRFKKIMPALLFFAAAAAAIAQTASSGDADEKTITLSVFIEKACSANPSFRKILHESYYLKYAEDSQLPEGNYTLGADMGYYYRPDSEKTGAGSSLSISKLFPETGTNAKAGWQFAPGIDDPSSGVTFEIYQDIARNAFGKEYGLTEFEISSRKKIAEHQITEAYEELMAVLIQEYYRWVSSDENLKTAENSYMEGKKLLENTIKREESRIASRVDVNQMTLTLLDKKENLVKTRAAYEKNVRKIKDFMKERSHALIRPEAASVSLSLGDNFETLFEETARHSRTFRILEEMEKAGLNSIEIKKRALLPSAELFVSYSYGGTGYLPEKETDRSLSVGISLNKAFPEKKEKASLETESLDYKKTRMSNEISRESLKLELYELYSEIKKTEVLLDLYMEKLSSAGIILKDEERDFAIGKSTLKDFTDAIKSIDSIRYGIESLKAEQNIYRIEWLRLTDNLVNSELSDLIK